MIKIIYSKHASDKRILYGLTKEQIERAVVRGATSPQTEGYLASYREIRIAYKKLGNNIYYLKTIYTN
ncbi:MAG TPA: hypothetical protein VJH95_04165 [Candidatus Nanoarchaeia archaeon]|nr:hypothetical protein [Candidatus Nanoarchaeia archaeon]